MKCSECDGNYVLPYDDEAEVALTFCGMLVEEIVTACHPGRAGSVGLDLVALDRSHQRKTRVVWSTRTSLSSFKKEPDLR